MELTRANMDALFTALNTSLNKGLAQADTTWTKWCNVIPSKGAIESYPITLVSGSMRKWIGDRQRNELSAKKLDVLNLDFEHTESVSRNSIEDDSIGVYNPLFEAMGINAANLWPQLATEALEANGKWADGLAFFLTNRKFGKATIENKFTLALTADNYETVRGKMMAYKGADGKPLGIIPTAIMVGATLEKTAKRIFKAEIVAEDGVAVSNINAGELEIIVNPFISDASWYVMCLNRGIKPIAVQQRKKGAMTRMDKDDSPSVFERNENDYGLHYRGAATGAMPQLITQSIPG